MGIPVDYSGTGWSLHQLTYEKPTIRYLQRWALAQLSCYAAAIVVSSRSNGGFYALLFWWIVPVLIGYPVVNFFRNLEHADCEVTKVPNCLRNTRSVRSNILVRTLLWDTNFHAEHHCYPMVPFYNLQKLNALMYDHVIHNEIDHFTTQNWAAIVPGGWIDQQMERFQAAAAAAAQEIEEKNE
jgi:fatty acid desaturase